MIVSGERSKASSREVIVPPKSWFMASKIDGVAATEDAAPELVVVEDAGLVVVEDAFTGLPGLVVTEDPGELYRMLVVLFLRTKSSSFTKLLKLASGSSMVSSVISMTAVESPLEVEGLDAAVVLLSIASRPNNDGDCDCKILFAIILVLK